MEFVDGENFTIRAQKYALSQNIKLNEGNYYRKDAFIWFPDVSATMKMENTGKLDMRIQDHSVRSYYYTSICGDDKAILDLRTTIWNCGFDPHVFKKSRKEDKAKGVDIALTIGMLGHAYMNNYDVAILFSGDADYTPVVNEVKRLGKAVYVCGFSSSGLSADLKLASDAFIDIEPSFGCLVEKISGP